MRLIKTGILITVVGLALMGIRPITFAQDQKSAPNHMHYKEPAPEASQASPTGALAPRLQKLGNHVFPVTTKNKQAQLFMNQGLTLSYAFNHWEAGRAYSERSEERRVGKECRSRW